MRETDFGSYSDDDRPQPNLFTREIVYGALSTQGWVELSPSITVGLGVCNCSHIAGDTI